MGKSVSCTLLLFTVFMAGKSARSQFVLSAENPTALQLQPGKSQTVQVAGAPHSLQVVEIRLGGGLVNVQSAETTRRVLDLGRGGVLLFAVEVPDNGTAELAITSAERLRNADLSMQIVTGKYSEEQRANLHNAGIAFALADSTRRHVPHAPETPSALSSYDVATNEALAAGDPRLARWAMAQKARFLLYQKSSFVVTRNLLQQAASLPDNSDPAEQALVYKTLSSCEYFLGDLQQAVADGERALALYRQTGDVYWQGVVLGNLLADYGELGRDDDAVAAAREALSDAKQTQDPAGMVFCLTELANLYRQEGSFEQAFEMFREGQTWAKDARYAPLVQADIEKALGEFYMELGLWAEAEDHLHICLEHTAPNSASDLEARGLLARTIERRGDFKNALREYTSAIGTANKLQLTAQEIQLLIGRSRTHYAAHQFAAALEDARNAAKLAQEQNSPALRIEASLAEAPACALQCKRLTEAEDLYRQAIRWIADTGEREQEAAAYAGLASVQAGLHNDQAALQSVGHALDLLEHSRASFASHDLAAGYFTERHGWYELAEDICLRLYRLHPEGQFQETAFEYSERARARAMLDALGDSHDVSGPALQDDLRRRISVNDHQVEIQKANLLSDSSPAKAAAALRHLYLEEDALEAERRKNETGRSLLEDRPIVSISGVQHQLLDAKTVLIAFSAGERSTYRWLITRSSVHIDVLPPMSDIDHRLQPLIKLLHDRRPAPRPGEDVAQYTSRLAQSDVARTQALHEAATLLLPALPLTANHLLIVASGSVLAIPWSALPTSCDGHPCFAVERFTISEEPSASIAIALAQRKKSEGSKTILVVSDPVPSLGSSNPRWAAIGLLPGTHREAEAIAHLVPISSFRKIEGTQATVENVKHGLESNIGILHMAAHTVLLQGHPELSGIALSANHSGANHDEGILWLHDIPHLQAPPLVVLSGCATQGYNFSGEEMNTLTQAFFYAGAQQVVASTWAVDDDVTAALMQDFYRNLLQHKLPAAEALRAAQIHRIQSHADIADWAPFLVDGIPAHSDFPLSARK